MNFAPNKICITPRGLQFINEEKEEFNEQYSNQHGSPESLTQTMSRTSSLPLLKSRSLLTQPKLVNQLSNMSRTKMKLERIGLKSMGEKKDDELIRRKLNLQFCDSNNYVKSIIPNLVRRTKQKNNNIEPQSRFQRARMYVARLEHNYKKKFVFRPKKNPQTTI